MKTTTVNAIYTCVTFDGREVKVRGNTSWEIRDIELEAEKLVGAPIQDVIHEEMTKTRAHS